jgi:hypothetical protein
MNAEVTLPCSQLERNAKGKALSIQSELTQSAKFWTFNDYYTVLQIDDIEVVFKNTELQQLLGFISVRNK